MEDGETEPLSSGREAGARLAQEAKTESVSAANEETAVKGMGRLHGIFSPP